MVGTHIRRLGFVAAMVLIALPLFAQTTGAVLQGTVADEQSGVLPGATITIVNVETGWTRDVLSDERGWYRAAALAPGRYEVRAALQGFVAYVRAGLVLTLGQEATVNVALRLATVAEVVTVTGDSPLVETTSNTIERTITRTDLDSLPLVGRNFANLATLSPGVAGVGGGGVSAVGADHPQQQLHHRRDQQRRHRGQRAARRVLARVGARVRRHHQPVQRRIRHGVRRHRQRDHALGHQSAPGSRVRLPSRRFSFDAQDPFSKAQGSGKAPFTPAALRRLHGRADPARSLPLLRLVRAAAGRDHQRRHLVPGAGRVSGKCRPRTWAISTSSRPTSA